MSKNIKILLHLIAWIIFLLLPGFFSMGKTIRFEELLNNPHDLQNFLSWILLIGFSYLNHLFLVPEFYLRKKYVHYAGTLLLCFAGILLLPEVTDLFMKPPTSLNFDEGLPPKPNELMESSHFILLFIVSIFFSASYHTQLRLQQTERQRLQNELDNLKAQIHPHFLFNTLNSIYSLAIRKDDKTPDALVQLSEFLRYIIKDAQGDLVALEKEITYLKNYVDLQKSRLRDSVLIDLKIIGTPVGRQIAPLILFSFIENAFQYGVNPEEDSVIKISIAISESSVHLDVFNKKVHSITRRGTGIGIKNSKKRLEILYPNQHDLKITETEADYKIELIINL